MTSYNLSVCIGPCLVWTNSSHPAYIERASVIIPKLIQFILDHHEAIFGEGVTQLLSATQLGKGASLSLDSVLMPDSQLLYQMSRKNRTPTSRHRGSLASKDSGLILYDDDSTENLVERTSPETSVKTTDHTNNNTQGLTSKESMKSSSGVSDNASLLNADTQEENPKEQENASPKRYLVRLTSLPYTVIAGNKIKSDYLYTTTVELPTEDTPDYIPTERDNSKQHKPTDMVIPARHNSQKVNSRAARIITRQRPRTVYYVWIPHSCSSSVIVSIFFNTLQKYFKFLTLLWYKFLCSSNNVQMSHRMIW